MKYSKSHRTQSKSFLQYDCIFTDIFFSRKNEEWLRQQNQSDKHDEVKEKMMKSGMLPRGGNSEFFIHNFEGIKMNFKILFQGLWTE